MVKDDTTAAQVKTSAAAVVHRQVEGRQDVLIDGKPDLCVTIG